MKQSRRVNGWGRDAYVEVYGQRNGRRQRVVTVDLCGCVWKRALNDPFLVQNTEPGR